MRKKTPDTSKLVRADQSPLGYTRAKSSDTNFVVAKTDKDAPKDVVKKDAAKPADPKAEARTDETPKPGDGPKAASNEPPVTIAPAVAQAAPPPAKVDTQLGGEPARARQDTMGMPVVMPVGEPPAMPTVEDPTNMPAAKGIPGGNPSDPALPPGRVPPGDSRSLRKGGEFALVYRQGTFVISRFGTVGQRGQWRVVEYPTSASASHSYAKECSRFVAEGFSDYRD